MLHFLAVMQDILEPITKIVNFCYWSSEAAAGAIQKIRADGGKKPSKKGKAKEASLTLKDMR